jgi:hypothetical protein
MAGGGQKGVGGIEFAGGMMILLGFIGGCTVRGWVDGQQSGDPLEQHQTACVQAWSDREAGKADEEAVTLLETTFCRQHNSIAVSEAQIEQQQDLQEAQTP